MRGNLQTRMKKLEKGDCDAILLAYAGVHRMELDHFIIQNLDLYEFTPPVGQGTVAIEASINLDQELKNLIVNATNDDETNICLQAERAYLNRLDGGCSIPSFAMASVSDNKLKIEGGIVSLDGSNIVRKSITGALIDAKSIGVNLAEEVLSDGGKEILIEIRKGL